MASSSLYRDESLDDESGDSSFDDYEESVEEYSEEEEESDEKGTTGEHHVQALVTVTKRVTLASEEEESSGEESTSGEDSDEDTDWEETLEPPTAKRRRAINDRSLRQCLQSGMYPTFLGTHGQSQTIDPRHNNALEYLQRLWTVELCELIADQTNLYILQRQAKGCVSSRRAPTTAAEIWTFLGVIVLMGVHVLPRFHSYWSRDEFLGIPALKQCMSRDRFKFLLRHLHLVDEANVAKNDRHYKVKPLVDILQKTFLQNYNPSQEIVVDELMIKCKGRAKGKVYMPNKPVKRGFKVWSLSCSCCGYLCNFQLYSGKVTASSEKGLAKRVVLDLVEAFTGINHVLYLDNYFTSVELAVNLRKQHIYLVGTAKSNCKDLPDSLKGKIKLEKGDYTCVTVGTGDSELNCFAYRSQNS